MADDTTPNITYELEGNKYDVLKLSQEAQSSYYVILEVEQEIRTLKKRIAVSLNLLVSIAKGYIDGVDSPPLEKFPSFWPQLKP